MTSRHRLIAILAVWALLALVAVVSNPAFGLWFVPPWAILLFNGLYLAGALSATFFITRSRQAA